MAIALAHLHVVNRFRSLTEPCNIRWENLEDALLLYTFFRDIDDEMSWIREKRPIAAMTDLGTNLQTVQSLQKKHQVIIVISASLCPLPQVIC